MPRFKGPGIHRIADKIKLGTYLSDERVKKGVKGEENVRHKIQKGRHAVGEFIESPWVQAIFVVLLILDVLLVVTEVILELQYPPIHCDECHCDIPEEEYHCECEEVEPSNETELVSGAPMERRGLRSPRSRRLSLATSLVKLLDSWLLPKRTAPRDPYAEHYRTMSNVQLYDLSAVHSFGRRATSSGGNESEVSPHANNQTCGPELNEPCEGNECGLWHNETCEFNCGFYHNETCEEHNCGLFHNESCHEELHIHDLIECEEHEHPLAVEIAEEVLHWLSVSILCIFLIELFVLILAFDYRFFLHPLYVIDLFIVTVSLVLELTLHQESLQGFLVILRLWRLIRISHGVVATVLEQGHHLKERYENEVKFRKELDAELHLIADTMERDTASAQVLINDLCRRAREFNDKIATDEVTSLPSLSVNYADAVVTDEHRKAGGLSVSAAATNGRVSSDSDSEF